LNFSKLGNTSSTAGAAATNSSFSSNTPNTNSAAGILKSPTPAQQRARISGAPLIILLGLHKPLRNAAQKAREAVRKRHEAEEEAAAVASSATSKMETELNTVESLGNESTPVNANSQGRSDIIIDDVHVNEDDDQVNNENDRPITQLSDENLAATRIQSVARGRQVRKSLVHNFENNSNAVASITQPVDSSIIQPIESSIIQPMDSSTTKTAVDDYISRSPIIESVSPQTSNLVDQNGAAIKIQSVTRGRQVRKSLAGERSSQIQQHFASPTASSLSKQSLSSKKQAVNDQRISIEEAAKETIPIKIPVTPLRDSSSAALDNQFTSLPQVDPNPQVLPSAVSTITSSNLSISEKRQHQIQLLHNNDALSSDSGQLLHRRPPVQHPDTSPALNVGLVAESNVAISQSPPPKQHYNTHIVTKLLNSPPPPRGSAVPSQIISTLRDAESKIEELNIELRVKEKMILELNTRCVRLSLKIAGYSENKESMMASVEKFKADAAQAIHDRDRMLQEKSAMEAAVRSIQDEVEVQKGLLREHEIALTGRDKDLFEQEKRIMMMAQVISQRDEEIRQLRKEMEESRTVAEARSGLLNAISRANDAEASLSALNDRFQAAVGECNELRSTIGVLQMAKTSSETIVSRLHTQLSDVMEKNKKLMHSKSLAERKSEALVRYVREHVMPDNASLSSSLSMAIGDRDDAASRLGAMGALEGGGGGDDSMKQVRAEMARKSKRIELLSSRVSELEAKLDSAEQASKENYEKAETARYVAKVAEKRAAALSDVLKRLKAAGVEVGLEQDLLAISKDNSALSTRGIKSTIKERKNSPTTSMLTPPAGSGSAAAKSKASRTASVSSGPNSIVTLEKNIVDENVSDQPKQVANNSIDSTTDQLIEKTSPSSLETGIITSTTLDEKADEIGEVANKSIDNIKDQRINETSPPSMLDVNETSPPSMLDVNETSPPSVLDTNVVSSTTALDEKVDKIGEAADVGEGVK
jgi:hypothetical protein